jgi:hypothetical protein
MIPFGQDFANRDEQLPGTQTPKTCVGIVQRNTPTGDITLTILENTTGANPSVVFIVNGPTPENPMLSGLSGYGIEFDLPVIDGEIFGIASGLYRYNPQGEGSGGGLGLFIRVDTARAMLQAENGVIQESIGAMQFYFQIKIY